MKNLFKRKKDKFPTAATPRTMEEIKAEHNQVAFQAGVAQYQARFYTQEVDKHNKLLESLNWEADARNKLDADINKAKEETTEVAK